MSLERAALLSTIDWELREAGPLDAEHTVLLLPGGMCSAGSYAELMAEPGLAGMRLVAATLPGHAGTPPPDDYGIENYARLAAELAKKVGADVVVGFSMGASVALEMVVLGGFTGARPGPRRTPGRVARGLPQERSAAHAARAT